MQTNQSTNFVNKQQLAALAGGETESCVSVFGAQGLEAMRAHDPPLNRVQGSDPDPETFFIIHNAASGHQQSVAARRSLNRKIENAASQVEATAPTQSGTVLFGQPDSIAYCQRFNIRRAASRSSS